MAIVDEAGLALEVDSSGLAEEIRGEVSRAMSEALAGQNRNLNIGIDLDQAAQARIRAALQRIETQVNQMVIRIRTKITQLTNFLIQKINQVFNRLKLRFTQAIEQARRLEARLKALPNHLDIQVNVRLDENAVREQLAALARDKHLDLEVRIDLAKALAEIEAFRKEQEANPINLKVKVDDDSIRNLQKLNQTVQKTVQNLDRAGTAQRGFSDATQRASAAAIQHEAALGRVTKAEDALFAAQVREDSAARRVAAADQQLAGIREAGDRATDDLERAEAALEDQRKSSFATAGSLRDAELRVSKAREALARQNAAFAKSEADLIDLAGKHRQAENALMDAENALGTAMTNLLPTEQRLTAGRAETEATSARLRDVEQDLATSRQAAEADAQRLARAEQELENGRNNGRTGTQRLAELETQVGKARDTAAASAGRAAKAEREVATARREHETALSRLQTAHERLGRAEQEHVGRLGRLGSAFHTVSSGLSGLGKIGSTVGQAFSGLSQIFTTVSSSSLSVGETLSGVAGGLGKLGGAAGAAAGAVLSVLGAEVQFGIQVVQTTALVSALTFVIGNLSAAVIALPGLLVAGAAAFGVIQLATEGFGDAIKEAKTPEELKKQQEALNKLEPAAKSTAIAFNQNLRPAINDLKKALQGAFFEGLDQVVRNLADTVKQLTPAFKGVATSINGVIKQLAGLVTGEKNVDRLKLVLANVKTLIDNMSGGVVKLVDSFLNVAAASDIMSTLGGIIGDVTGEVGRFIDEVTKSGQAARVLEGLRGVINSLLGVLESVAKKAMDFAEAANPGVSKALDYVKSAIDKIDFKSLGESVGRAAEAFGRLLDSIPPGTWATLTQSIKNVADEITKLANDPAIQSFATAAVNALSLAINFFAKFLAAVRTAANGVLTMVKPLASVSDALGLTNHAADAVGTALSGLPPIVENAGKGMEAAGRAGATATVNGIKIPIAALPGLTQEQFDKLPQIAKDSLIDASTQVQAGAAAIPKGYQGEMSRLPGITKQAYDAIPPEMRPGLDKALADSNKGAADIGKGVGDNLAAGVPGVQDAANRLVNAVTIPVGTLPGVTQQQIDALSPVMKDGLAKAVQGGVTEVSKLSPELQKALGPVGPTVAAGVAPAAPAARAGMDDMRKEATAGAVAMLGDVEVPIKQLPGLTQEQFHQLPQIAKNELAESAENVKNGGQLIPRNLEGPMSEVPGISRKAFEQLPKDAKDLLLRLTNESRQNAGKVPGAVKEGVAPTPQAAGDAVKPTGDAVKQGLDPAAQKATEAGGQIVEALKTSLGPAGQAATEALAPFPQAVKAALDGAAAQATASMARVVQAVRTELAKLPQAATEATTGFTASIIAAFEPSVAQARTSAQRIVDAARVELARLPQVTQQALGNGLKDAVTKACADGETAMRDGVAKILAAANFAGIATSAETELAKIPVSVQTHLTAASAGVTQIGTAMVTSWQGNMTQLPTITNDTWTAVVRTITEQGQQAQTQAQTVARAILQVFLDLAQPMYVAGVNMMSRLAAGITAGGQQAVAAAQNVAQKIQGLFPQSPPKWGPLSGEGDTLKSGAKLMDRLAAGVEGQQDRVLAAFAPTLNAIAGSLDGASPSARANAVAATSMSSSVRATPASQAPAAPVAPTGVGAMSPDELFHVFTAALNAAEPKDLTIRDNQRGGVATIANRQNRQAARRGGR